MAGNVDIKKLKENVAKSVTTVLEAQTQSVNEGMLDLIADFKDRIFLNGQDSDNSPIGSYSTKPIYVSVPGTSQVKSSGLKARGKAAKKGQRNQGKFKNGKDRKSMYIPGGYSEYRKLVRRFNDKVYLSLTGSLEGDIAIGDSGGNITMAFTTDKQKEIASGNETRFGKTIFSANPELDKFVERVQNDVSNAFFDSFK
jgi:hypothetical protein